MKPCRRETSRRAGLPAALLGTCSTLAGAPETARGAERAVVEVRAAHPPAPQVVVVDPRDPSRHSAPDGADLLRAVPGFAVVRKAGIDGDPVLRGMAGSRLGILADGEATPGGCGGRMDPPTAYLVPESYDRVEVVKGPQSVCYGPGNSAGTVLFQRSQPCWDRPGWVATGSLTAGSFGREDLVLDVQGGTPRWYGRGIATRARCGDYRSGDGQEVHARYARWSLHGALGWTPGPGTRLELRGNRSDGQAAYADRGMDGVRFLRRNTGLAFETQDLAGSLEKLEFQAYRNDIDHVMDNASLRGWAPSAKAPEPMARNPQRTTLGARLALTFGWETGTRWILGADLQDSRHTVRRSSRQASMPVLTLPRVADAAFRSVGVFGEWSRAVHDSGRLIAGLRLDHWHALDLRASLPLGGVPDLPNPTAGQERNLFLASGFLRGERAVGAHGILSAGLGHVARPPDYWELIPVEGPAGPSAFQTRAERTTQLDFGYWHRTDRFQVSCSGFYGQVADFVLIQSGVAKPSHTGAVRPVTLARNIRAGTWGGEVALAAPLTSLLRLDGSVAGTWGENRTDGIPLAQIPPLESRLGLTWGPSAWFVRGSLRMVAPQDRYALNQGSIAGQDLGRTPGFAVLALAAGWTPYGAKGLRVACGVDNLFDRAYREHLSRSASGVPGYPAPTFRIPEPGRTLWLKVVFTLP